MADWIIHNGSIISDADFSVDASNRAFRFGDGLFESLFISNQIPAFITLHFDRLKNAMRLLQITIPQNWSENFFTESVKSLCEKNNIQHARCRITIWRAGTGLYSPETDAAEWIIQLWPVTDADYLMNPAGLHLGVYDQLLKPVNSLSAIKSANALVSVLAARYAREQKFDDVVILNNRNTIAEATGSNIFIYRERKLYTPALSDGCVDGVMRRVVVALCKNEGIPVLEVQLLPEDLLDAEEVFLSNAVVGIKWVQKFQHRHYENTFSTDLLFVINEAKNNPALVSPRPPSGG